MPRVLIFFLLLVALTLPLHATVVTASFTGYVTTVNGTPGVSVGDAIHFTYSYDTTQSGYYDTTFGYTMYSLPTFDLSVDALSLTTYPYGQLRVCNDCWGPVDYLEFLTAAGNPPTGQWIQYLWFLRDYSATVFSNENLPESAPNIADYTPHDNQIVIQSFDPSGGVIWEIYGTVPVTTPEPASLTLMVVGLLGLVSLKQRR